MLHDFMGKLWDFSKSHDFPVTNAVKWPYMVRGNYRSREGWGLWSFYTAGGKGLFTWSDMRSEMRSIWTNHKGPFTLIGCKICQCKADVFCSTTEIVNNTFVSDIAFTMNDSENQTKFNDSWTMKIMGFPYEGWAFPQKREKIQK